MLRIDWNYTVLTRYVKTYGGGATTEWQLAISPWEGGIPGHDLPSKMEQELATVIDSYNADVIESEEEQVDKARLIDKIVCVAEFNTAIRLHFVEKLEATGKQLADESNLLTPRPFMPKGTMFTFKFDDNYFYQMRIIPFYLEDFHVQAQGEVIYTGDALSDLTMVGKNSDGKEIYSD